MAAPYHSLAPPHGPTDLYLPDGPEDLRAFFVRCMESRDFQSANSERHQVHLCKHWSTSFYDRPLSLEQLAQFFGVGRSTIYYHLSRPFDVVSGCECGELGRPKLMSDEQLEAVRRFVQERFEQKVPATYDDIVEFVADEFDEILNINSLRNFLARSNLFKSVDGVPLEDSRLFSRPDQIDEYFRRLDEIIQTAEIPAAFIMNVDESGFNEFVDARHTTRIVPAEYEFDSVPVPITRAEKRATLVAAICADGHAMRPMVVLQRETVESELLLRGYTLDKVHLTRSDKGFVTTKLFLTWGRDTLIPEVRRRRAEFGYDGPALLLLDGFGCHQGQEFVSLCEEENIICLMFPPHTSDQLQPCDLGIFGNQKKLQSRISVDTSLNRQTKQVIRIIDSFRCATTPKNVVGAFRKSGIVTFLDEKTLLLKARVDTRYASAVRHLQQEAPDQIEGDKRRINID